ncbi:MAG: hypothetical protein AAF416_03455 [Pseudomonadota bacterium]
MFRSFMLVIFCALPMVMAAAPAQAYIGPGLGAGTIAVVIGVLASIAMALLAVLYYPIKRMLKKRKPAETAPANAREGEGS